LWEFAHLQTGDPPERGDDGTLIITEKTGLVFVLIPGGTFRMGAHRPSEEHPEGSPNVDPWADESEKPVHEVTVRPFFMSKYEMTQGQWLRFTGVNPSYCQPAALPIFTLRHPVEQVSWEQCSRVLKRLGLALPTEAQWEYACRAGTTTVWYTGNERVSLKGHANLEDQTSGRSGVKSPEYEAWLDDGHGMISPVGAYAANAFGLHDMHGNVAERCRDVYTPSYESPETDKEAERRMQEGLYHVNRGGSYSGGAVSARAAYRACGGIVAPFIGVRPVRLLEE
jgi:formylglycine-generating enzyme required for sulfatase activity